MTTQDRIVVYLQGLPTGLVFSDDDVADKIGRAIDVPGDRVRSALGALEARGLLVANYFRAELTDKGRAHVVSGVPDTTESTRGPVLVDVSAGTGRVADRESAGAGSERSVAAPSPVPVQTSTRKEQGVITGKQHMILQYLEDRGGKIEDESGGCAPHIALACDIGGGISDALKRLAARDLIARDVRGKRTYVITLTPGGRKVLAEKGATNGEVPKLRGGTAVGANGSRQDRPARRKARAPARAKAAKRGSGRRGGATRKAATGRGRRRDGDAGGVGQPLPNLRVRGPAPQDVSADEVAAFQALLRLTPPLRRRVIAFVEIASGSGAE